MTGIFINTKLFSIYILNTEGNEILLMKSLKMWHAICRCEIWRKMQRRSNYDDIFTPEVRYFGMGKCYNSLAQRLKYKRIL